ncbi:MAG: hypothetical protein ACI83B_002916 [Sediminicola sp.]|jgi:hypothetical protein
MILKYIPITLKKRLYGVRKNLKMRLNRITRKKLSKDSSRIFCLSMQRSGTTSVGDFFEQFGYPVARNSYSRQNSWGESWFNGDFESIFKSKDFKSFQVFEDSPWWFTDFYKVLYHRFPNSKFVLFTRDSDSWFKSMVSHSNGQTLGNTKVHCKVYRREKEYNHKLDTDPSFKPSNKIDNLLTLDGHREHYKEIYDLRNREIIDFFNENDSSRLIVCDLRDSNKWKRLGEFFGIEVPADAKYHSHNSLKNKNDTQSIQ